MLKHHFQILQSFIMITDYFMVVYLEHHRGVDISDVTQN